jgi:hypothetical protein
MSLNSADTYVPSSQLVDGNNAKGCCDGGGTGSCQCDICPCDCGDGCFDPCMDVFVNM